MQLDEAHQRRGNRGRADLIESLLGEARWAASQASRADRGAVRRPDTSPQPGSSPHPNPNSMGKASDGAGDGSSSEDDLAAGDVGVDGGGVEAAAERLHELYSHFEECRRGAYDVVIWDLEIDLLWPHAEKMGVRACVAWRHVCTCSWSAVTSHLEDGSMCILLSAGH